MMGDKGGDSMSRLEGLQLSVIMGIRARASILSGAPQGRRPPAHWGGELLVLSMLSAWGCTLTSDEFQPSPVVVTETDPAAGASPGPEQPAGSTEYPAPMLDPGEVEPPFILVPDDTDDTNAGGTRTGEDDTEVLDAGADASDGGDAGSGEHDAGAAASDASTPGQDASTGDHDAGAEPSGVDASTPSEPDASTPPSAPCPGLVFEDSCYEFFAEQVSWNLAEERCVAWGGHLASVESLEEDAFLGAWPALVGIGFWDGSGLWLGGTDARADGDFRWWDGSALTYVGWASDQPNNGQGVDCIEKRNDFTQRWYDRRCTDGERYVCERPQ